MCDHYKRFEQGKYPAGGIPCRWKEIEGYWDAGKGPEWEGMAKPKLQETRQSYSPKKAADSLPALKDQNRSYLRQKYANMSVYDVFCHCFPKEVSLLASPSYFPVLLID
jgi:hypothetical protein